MTLIARDGRIEKVFYPVFPPDDHVYEVLDCSGPASPSTHRPFLALLDLPVASVAGEPVAESGSGSAVLPDLTRPRNRPTGWGNRFSVTRHRLSCPVHWNQGEAFPSLGIGHFIWYPAGVVGLRRLSGADCLPEKTGCPAARLAEWAGAAGCALADRAVFMESRQSLRVEQLREFLYETRGLQVRFILGGPVTRLTSWLGCAG